MPRKTKLALGICHLPVMAGQMLLFSMISIFFYDSYMNMRLFFLLFSMILVSSF